MSLRKIHLATSLFLLPFLLAFAISAVEFAHRTWVSHPVRVTEEHRVLSAGVTDARIVAREWRGELDAIETPAGSLKFRVVTPLGTTYDVDYSIATGDTTIKTATPSFLTMLAFLHISHGIWSYVTPAVSAGLLTLGLTGLYLWFKNRQERRVGVALLLIGVGIPMGLIISMRLS
jgi:hypothetical protein